jgi:hypothetical protein
MTLPFQNSPFQKFPNDHPQIDIIRHHITVAMQDLFLISMRNLDDEFIVIFDSEKEIDDFCQGMITYRESKEEYEVCTEIVQSKPKIIQKWRTFESGTSGKNFDEIKAWLKSTT